MVMLGMYVELSINIVSVNRLPVAFQIKLASSDPFMCKSTEVLDREELSGG